MYRWRLALVTADDFVATWHNSLISCFQLNSRLNWDEEFRLAPVQHCDWPLMMCWSFFVLNLFTSIPLCSIVWSYMSCFRLCCNSPHTTIRCSRIYYWFPCVGINQINKPASNAFHCLETIHKEKNIVCYVPT